MPTPSKTLYAIGLMLLSMACFAAMGIAVRLLSLEMHSAFMVFLRNAVGLLIVVAWAGCLQRGLPRFPTLRLKAHFWRSAIGIISMELMFYCMAVMPLTLVVALSFTTPIFTTIFAILLLGEKAGMRRWSAMIIGFIGVWIILQPDRGGIDVYAGAVLLSSALIGIVGIMIKTLTRTDAPETIVFYMALFMIPLSLPPAIPYWQAVTPPQWWLVFLVAFFSTAAHLFLARAFMHADMVVLMPFDFTRLIFISVLAYFFFGEIMDGYTLAGGGLIVMSTVYIAHREAQKRREPEKNRLKT